jgi:hypothetical protein
MVAGFWLILPGFSALVHRKRAEVVLSEVQQGEKNKINNNNKSAEE